MLKKLIFTPVLLIALNCIQPGKSDFYEDYVKSFKPRLLSPSPSIAGPSSCFVPGHCRDFAVDFVHSTNPDHCLAFCRNTTNCNWFSFNPSQELCMAFANCTELIKEGCDDCVLGQNSCSPRICGENYSCRGHLSTTFVGNSLNECILNCKIDDQCQFYTYEKSNRHCILYRDCDKHLTCPTCESGERSCGIELSVDQILDDWDDGKDGNDLGVSPKDEGKRLLDPWLINLDYDEDWNLDYQY